MTNWTHQQKLAYYVGKLSMADEVIAALRQRNKGAGIVSAELNRAEAARAEVIKQIEFMAESWYTAITQGLFSGQAEQPERAIKKAFQKLAVHHYGYPSRYCAICEERMGDDIECYEQECDETIRQLIPAFEE